MTVILAPAQLPRNDTECNGTPELKGVAFELHRGK